MKVGDTVGKYKIVEVLGEGGMGVVYKAWEEPLSRYVALKSFKIDELDSLDFFKRFLSEAKIVAQIKHPTMIAIYEINTSTKTPFIAMEFLEGKNLREKALSEALSIEYIMETLEKLAEGFHAVHQNKILHRDIKPANMFVTNVGELKILDFGISKWEKDPNAAETVANQFIGTITYCAPEIFRFKSQSIQSEVFSLGVTISYLLLLESVFNADDPSGVVEKIQFEEVEFPEHITKQFPRKFIDLLLEMLEKDPRDRPADMQMVAQRAREIRKSTSQTILARNLIRDERQAKELLAKSSVTMASKAKKKKRKAQRLSKVPRQKVIRKESKSNFGILIPYTALLAAIAFGVFQYMQKDKGMLKGFFPEVAKTPLPGKEVKKTPHQAIDQQEVEQEVVVQKDVEQDSYSYENQKNKINEGKQKDRMEVSLYDEEETNSPQAAVQDEADLLKQVKDLLQEGKRKGLTFEVLENVWIPQAEEELKKGYTSSANDKLRRSLDILQMRVSGNIKNTGNRGHFSGRSPSSEDRMRRPNSRHSFRSNSIPPHILKGRMDLIEDIREQAYLQQAPNDIRSEIQSIQQGVINAFNQRKETDVDKELTNLKQYAEEKDWKAFRLEAKKIQRQLK